MDLLTIFTPTYNRAHLLKNLYESLNRQSDKRFEWIIIDDDSSDETPIVVDRMISCSDGFDIIYQRQEHGGKHRAINKAVKLAKGEYFFIVDSDDYITDDAVEKIFSWISTISDNNCICGVAGLRANHEGQVWGGAVQSNGQYMDASNLERKKLNLMGDKAEVYKTNILKEFPFPEFDDEDFITEDVCWNAIAASGYKVRWFNEVIYLCEYLEDGLTKNGANERTGHIKNFRGYAYYVKQSLKIKPEVLSITDFREFNRTCSDLKMSFSERAKAIDISLVSYVVMFALKMPVLYAIRMIRRKKGLL